jgi:hypothetical protein
MNSPIPLPLLFLLSSPLLASLLSAQAPIITSITAPRQIVEAGGSVTLEVQATGATHYQWRRNGFAIPGATASTLTLAAAHPTKDNGWYQAIVSNQSGLSPATTRSAAIFVLVSSANYQVRHWGIDKYGEGSIPAALSRPVGLAGGWAHSLAITAAGTVVGWGYQGPERRASPPAGLSDVVALSALTSYSLALRANGTVLGWGLNDYGETRPPAGLRDVVAIAAGYDHALALRSDGTVVGWGLNSSGQTTIPPTAVDIVAIAAGEQYSLALRADGTVVAWGLAQSGRTEVPANLRNVRAISVYKENSIALLDNGTLVSWGSTLNQRNEVPLGTLVQADLGLNYGLGLRPNGQVVAWGEVSLGGGVDPRFPEEVVQLVAANSFNLALVDTRSVIPAAPAAVTRDPTPQIVETGGTLRLAVLAEGSPSPTYQWLRNGQAIAGATSFAYVDPAIIKAEAGTYEVVVTNVIGTTTHTQKSAAANVEVVPTSRLSNLSVRTSLAPAQVLTLGAVAAGQPKTFLIRAGGPALNAFGLQGMADPRLDLYRGTPSPSGSNDDWNPALASVFQSVGAFPYAAGSRDAALNPSLTGAFTVEAKGTGPGAVLVEAYDVTGGITGRLVNLSARNQVGTGDDILIAGFAISGTGTKQVLIRAVGPGLTGFGVPGALADPRLAVFSSAGARLAENDNWGTRIGTATLATAANFSAVGAFPLNANSRDAAILITLNAGASYTVQVAGVNNTTGEALIEVYEVF